MKGTSWRVLTVPQGSTCIVKQVALEQITTTTCNPRVGIHDAASTVTVRIINQNGVTAPSIAWAGWFVMNQGDWMAISVAETDVDYWVSGALLPFYGAPYVPQSPSPALIGLDLPSSPMVP